MVFIICNMAAHLLHKAFLINKAAYETDQF